MANRQNGEVALAACGREYKLKFGTYALAELEDRAGRSFRELLEELNDENRFRVKTAILFIWAGLQDHHPDADLREAASIIDDLGLQSAGNVLSDALVLAFPELGVAEDGAENPKGNRRQRRATAAKAKTA